MSCDSKKLLKTFPKAHIFAPDFSREAVKFQRHSGIKSQELDLLQLHEQYINK